MITSTPHGACTRSNPVLPPVDGQDRAQCATSRINLHLGARRWLTLTRRVRAGGTTSMDAALTQRAARPGGDLAFLVFATTDGPAHLDRHDDGSTWSVWIGTASFHVSNAVAKRIQEFLQEHGA